MPEPNFEEAESAESESAESESAESESAEAESAEAVPLFQCDDCGNFWDGAAQCLCGGWGLEAEEDSESGYESY